MLKFFVNTHTHVYNTYVHIFISFYFQRAKKTNMYFQMGWNFVFLYSFQITFLLETKFHGSIVNTWKFPQNYFRFFTFKYGFCNFFKGTMVPEHRNFTLQQNGPSNHVTHVVSNSNYSKKRAIALGRDECF